MTTRRLVSALMAVVSLVGLAPWRAAALLDRDGPDQMTVDKLARGTDRGLGGDVVGGDTTSGEVSTSRDTYRAGV